MKISIKLALLVVFVSAAMVFAAAKPAKDAKMTVKDANTATKEVKAPAPDATAEKKAPETPEVAPEAKPPVVAPKPPAPVDLSAPVDPNEVAVTVNGIDITEGQIDAKIKPRLARISSQMTPAVAEQYKKRMKGQALEGMIIEQLLNEQVKKSGITVTDSDVNDKITEIITQQGMTMDVFKSMLQAQGQDFAQVTHDIGQSLGYEKLLASQMGGVDINDAEAKAAYEQNIGDYNIPEQVRASHILIKPDPNIVDVNQAKAQALKKAQDLLKQIKGGADFATLAKESSDCPSKVQGGDLDFFERGKMVKPFENAAFALQPGQVSDVVETQFGYHIIKITDHKAAGIIPFEKVKPEIIKMLKDQKMGQFSRQYIEKLKAEAKIVYPPGKDPKAALMPPAAPGKAQPAPTPMPTPAPATTPN